jgi:hypothetical protein
VPRFVCYFFSLLYFSLRITHPESTSASDRRQQSVSFTLNNDQLANLKSTRYSDSFGDVCATVHEISQFQISTSPLLHLVIISQFWPEQLSNAHRTLSHRVPSNVRNSREQCPTHRERKGFEEEAWHSPSRRFGQGCQNEQRELKPGGDDIRQ